MRRVNVWVDLIEDGWSPNGRYADIKIRGWLEMQRPWSSPDLIRAFGYGYEWRAEWTA